VPSALPDGEPAPRDGRLPDSAFLGQADRPFAFYVHVPFCRVRCGYCDFNTYTARELGGGASQDSYALTAVQEVALARRVLGDVDRPVETVFLGGGTPTLLPARDLGLMLRAIDDEFGLAPGAEVTTEANPDSVDLAYLVELREAGFNRLSFGMQSAVPSVLQVLDRTHDPERVPRAVEWAREAGFDLAGGGSISLDLIYGTPGERIADWETSLRSALACAPDHISAYALIVEDGTALARQVRRGELPMPDDDDLADKYLLADELLSGNGLDWYEVSNWSRPGAACRHNLLYWKGADWWGVGPGAHSHVGGVRWWNVKHPSAYAQRLGAGESPAHGREVLAAEDQRVERVLLELRLADGLDPAVLDDAGRAAVPGLVADGLLEPAPLDAPLVLTTRGRLLADAVVRDLLP
jgi:putative oxygen-independent coproporphyrinogen III oxidase